MLAALAALIVCSAQDGPAEAPCHVHGRVVDEAGAPVRGARVVAAATGGWTAPVARAARQAGWKDPEVVTDEDGRFALRFVPPADVEFEVRVEREGLARRSVHALDFAAGEESALGDLVLVRPGVIEGHLEGPEGELLVGPWRVLAWTPARDLPRFVTQAKPAAVDPRTGVFRIDDLAPGEIVVIAVHVSGTSSAMVTAVTDARVATYVAVAVPRVESARRITVQLSSQGFARELLRGVEPPEVRVETATGAPVRVVRPVDGQRTFQTEDLPEADYRVVIDDPRIVPWEEPHARPGAWLSAVLVGSSRLRLSVLDPDGARVTAYRLSARATSNSGRDSFEVLHGEDTSPPRDGVHGGFVAGSYELRIVAPGVGEYRGQVDDLGAGETRTLEARLAPTRRLTGRVVHADGSPLARGAAHVTLGDRAGSDGCSVEWVADNSPEGGAWVERARYEATADVTPDGTFDLGEIRAERAVVSVDAGDWVHCAVHVDLATHVGELVVTLPAVGDVAGRIAGVAVGPLERLVVRPALGDGADPDQHERWSLLADGALVDAGGEFRLGPLLAGATALELVRERRDPRAEEGALWASVQETTLARFQVLIPAGATATTTLDLATRRPRVDVPVQITLGGAAATGLVVVELTPRAEFDATGRETEPASLSSLDGAGRIRLALVGEYTVTVHDQTSWSHTFPEPAVVAESTTAGLAAPLERDVPWVTREVCVLGADGAPHAAAPVWIAPATGGAPGVTRTTSPSGALVLSLPPARYLARTRPPSPFDADTSAPAAFEWSEADVALTLRLPAAPGESR